MAVGWANDDSVSQQIQNTIDEISRVRGSITEGESAHYCDECGDEIPEARRLAMKSVRLCIECQSTIELASQRQVLFNRRASKDSQLR